jgi:hypothetical protein
VRPELNDTFGRIPACGGNRAIRFNSSQTAPRFVPGFPLLSALRTGNDRKDYCAATQRHGIVPCAGYVQGVSQPCVISHYLLPYLELPMRAGMKNGGL